MLKSKCRTIFRGAAVLALLVPIGSVADVSLPAEVHLKMDNVSERQVSLNLVFNFDKNFSVSCVHQIVSDTNKVEVSYEQSDVFIMSKERPVSDAVVLPERLDDGYYRLMYMCFFKGEGDRYYSENAGYLKVRDGQYSEISHYEFNVESQANAVTMIEQEE